MPGVGAGRPVKRMRSSETRYQSMGMGLGDKLGVAGGGKPIEFLSDYRQLLDDGRDDIDAVILCTPNFQHVEFLKVANGRRIGCYVSIHDSLLIAS